MRKIYWLVVLSLSFVIPGCGDDEDGISPSIILPPVVSPPPIIPDSVAPKITLNSPYADDTYLAIGRILVNAQAKDNTGTQQMRLFVKDPSGASKSIDVLETGIVNDGKEKYIMQFIKPESKVTGGYTIIVEAEDLSKNITRDSVQIYVIVEDLSKLNYYTAFTSTGWYEYSNTNDTGLNLDEFEIAFYFMINKYQWDYDIDPAYVNEFGEDFGGHSQLWDTWDVNKNSQLDFSELQKGLDDLKFFDTWDFNTDNLISENELADGIGKLWDVNKDNEVTAAEFEQKIRKYFLFD